MMSYYLLQVILAVRNRNDNDRGWMQLLVFIVLAVFYGLGSLLKARARKAESEKKQQKPSPARPQRSQRQVSPLFRTFKQALYQPARPAAQARPQSQPPRRKIARPQPVAQKPTAQKLSVSLEPANPPESAVLMPSMPSVKPHLKETPHLAVPPAANLKAKYTHIPTKAAEAEAIGQGTLDLGDPDRLKRAIIHYEIFGKPLSLRQPSERIY